MNPQVSIIILNRNWWQDTIECLESVFRNHYPCYEVILIDNFSTDNSLEHIENWLHKKQKISSKYYGKILCTHKVIYNDFAWVINNKKFKIIQNKSNLGFAWWNNVALEYVYNQIPNSEFVLFLNNDTIVHKDFLGNLVKTAQNNSMLGSVASKNVYYDNADIVRYAGGKINRFVWQIKHIWLNHVDDGRFDSIIETEYWVGSSLLVKTELLKRINWFDEKYFAYSEDADLCLRINKLWFKNYYCWTSKIYHKVSQSSSKVSDFANYLQIRNNFWLIKSNFSLLKFIVFIIIQLIYKLPAKLIKWKIKLFPTIKGLKDWILK